MFFGGACAGGQRITQIRGVARRIHRIGADDAELRELAGQLVTEEAAFRHRYEPR